MSFVTTSDQLPQWAQHCPVDWPRDWLKWHVSHHAQRPTEEQAAGLPYISNEDITSWTGKLLREDPQPSESDGRLFERDDVLFNKLRPYLAKVYHADFDGISSGELLCLHSSTDVVPRFLFYVLASKGFVDAVDSASFGSKMPRADWEIVGHQPLPLPPFETQRRIARFLDAKTARIDALIAKKRALLEQLAEKRQALITQTVTKGLAPGVPTKDSGINGIGCIPAHWKRQKLGYAYRVGSGTTPTSGDDSYYTTDGGISWITTTELREVVICKTMKNLTSKALREFPSLRIYKPDSVFLAMYGATIGRLGMNAIPATCNQACCVFEESLWFVNQFLFYWLWARRNDLIALSVGGGQPNLSQEDLRQEIVPCPPIDEQHAIVTYLSSTVGRMETVMERVRHSVHTIKEYRAALITAAVTGQLDIPAAPPDDQAEAPLGTLATEEA